MRQLSSLCLAILMLALLAGCGQKGPLYLPGDEEAAETYDPGNAYADEQGDEQGDEQADDNGDDSDDSQKGNDDGEAETTSGDEG